MYYTILAIEQVYAEWIMPGLGMPGSYRIFLEITKVYEHFAKVEEGCAVTLILQSLWNKTITGQVYLDVGDIDSVVSNVLLFWYGIAWTNYEDCGLAMGIWIKLMYRIDMDDFITSASNWECPPENEIGRATYNEWIIGWW